MFRAVRCLARHAELETTDEANEVGENDADIDILESYGSQVFSYGVEKTHSISQHGSGIVSSIIRVLNAILSSEVLHMLSTFPVFSFYFLHRLFLWRLKHEYIVPVLLQHQYP